MGENPEKIPASVDKVSQEKFRNSMNLSSIYMCQVILCDRFGIQRISDLQLGDKIVTLNHLVRVPHSLFHNMSYEPGSKLLVLGMVIQPLIGNPYNGYINPYYWVDDHPLLYGNNGSLDPSTYV